MKQLILLVVLTCLASCYSKKPVKTGLEGKPLPEFTVMLPDSATYLKTSHLPTGKPLVVFYFSPFCPHCQAQTEDIIDEMDKIKDINFLYVTAYPLNTLKGFIKQYQLQKYPNIITCIDTAHFVRNYYETAGVPYMAIYGKDRKLNNSFLGEIDVSQVRKVAEE